MPEGPEIRREADAVHRALAGRVAHRVRIDRPGLRSVARLLEGEEVLGAEARGKALLVHFANGLALYAHNQLYGRWRVVAAGTRPASGRQLRAEVENEARAALLYSASEITVLEHARLGAHPYLARLGPDVLDEGLTEAAVRARLRDPGFARRSLGALLLDQGFLAGVGNYLRSEILFAARLAPGHRPADLPPAAQRRLARAALAVPRRALATGGVTLDPTLARRMERAGVPRRERRFHVFARAGRPCTACGAPVEKREAAGRRLYLCPRCQEAG